MAAGEADVITAIAAAKEAAANSAVEKLQALGEEVGEDEKTYKEAEFKAGAALEVVVGLKEGILALGQCNIPPKGETIKAFTALAMLAGHDKADYIDSLTNKVEWTKLRALIAEELFEKMSAFDASAWTAEGATEEIKAAVEGLDEAGTPFSHILPTASNVGAILTFINASLARVEAYAVFKQKEEEARIAAEEAAAAAAEAGGE